MEIRHEKLKSWAKYSQNLELREKDNAIWSKPYNELNVEELRHICYRMWEHLGDYEREGVLEDVLEYVADCEKYNY